MGFENRLNSKYVAYITRKMFKIAEKPSKVLNYDFFSNDDECWHSNIKTGIYIACSDLFLLAINHSTNFQWQIVWKTEKVIIVVGK